jgi:8-oxo-dGTP diphosphatase
VCAPIPTPMCLCFILDGQIGNPSRVLLGHKKRGLGTGNLVGLGGHIDPGETGSQAAVREVTEESGLRVDESDLAHLADVAFSFPARPSWDQTAAVFVADRWRGDPVSTDEITPEWFAFDMLPLDRMWDDAKYWLPRVLAGERLHVDIVFADDCRTVRDATIQPLGWSTGRHGPATEARRQAP